MPANDAWEWRSQNRAAFHDYHGPEVIGHCECGAPIHEGETFVQSVGREADGSTTVLTCRACLERNEAEAREMAVREGWI